MRLEPLYVLPFLSAALWILAGLASLPRGRSRNPTEAAFVLFLVLLGLWALVDAAALQTTDAGVALALVRARDAIASAGGLALLCFAKWSTRGRSSADVALAAPVLAAIGIGWLGAVGVVMEPWGPRAVRDLPLFAAWFLQSFLYAMAAFAFLAVGLRALWRQDRPVAKRAVSVLVATGIATVLAITTNIAITFTGSTAPPPFSSLLVIPGAALLASALVAPIPQARVVQALRRMVLSFDRDILGASVLGDDGTIYAIAMQEPRDRQQFDLPEVMVMVQQFASASPRVPPGRQGIASVGGVRFLLRRGSGVTMVVAVRGRDHDFLDAAVDEAFARIQTTTDLASAREGSIPSMGRIGALLREFIARPVEPAGENR